MTISRNNGREASDDSNRDPKTGPELERLAALLATDEVRWPDGLTPDQAAQLAGAVRCQRQSRLIKIIAQQIANSLTGDQIEEVPPSLE